jgi:hypothetical protein
VQAGDDQDEAEESFAITLMAMSDEIFYAFGGWLVMAAMAYDKELQARRVDGH